MRIMDRAAVRGSPDPHCPAIEERMNVMELMRNVLAVLLLPVRIPLRLMVAFYAWLYWRESNELTGNPVRRISLTSPRQPYRQVKEALVRFYDVNGRWPQSFSDLDPYGLMEFTQLSWVNWTVQEDGQLSGTMFFRYGKGAYRVTPPQPAASDAGDE